MDERVRIMLAEAVGTAVLVIGGCGTAIFAAGNVPERAYSGVGVLGVATAFGLSLLIMAYAIGHISGCHVNPAVTLGLVVSGKLKAGILPFYWVGQVVGGLAAGATMRLVLKWGDGTVAVGNFAANGYGKKGSPLGFDLGAVAIVEVMLTAVLIFVVLSTTHPRFPAGFGGLAAGGALWLIHLISIPISNTSVNPARSLAVAPFAPRSIAMEQLWAFIVFPLLGGAIGAVVFRVVNLGKEGDESVPDIEGTIPGEADLRT